jgi:ATP-dependent DNA helicase RecQ
MANQAKHILKQVFGYDEFRPLQAEIIDNVLNRRDTLVIMPTGGGKSLCYQIPGLLFPGLTIVVSPLISLMKDQVEQLVQAGAPAAFLNSSLSLEEYRRRVQAVKNAAVKLLYMAPEALLRPNMLTLLSSLDIACLTIDEAHCISEWGHDFRPEYRQIAKVRGRFPDAVCIALTATATPRVREDIKASLGFRGSNEFVGSFNRENLFIRVAHKIDPLTQTIDFIEEFPEQSGIIYCFSRRQVDDLSEILTLRGYSVRPYHAGMSDADRNENQERFIKDDVQIMVATIAFGMGIDKPNVRFVVHYDLPKNMEGYYQEIGRAGRDGLPAHCLLLFSYADIRKIKHFIDQKDPHEQRIANIHLNAFLGFIETELCRRVPLLDYFGETYTKKNCGACDNCLTDEKDLADITISAQKFLSCVKRTGERFGAGHIIDVLCGSKARKVLGLGHDKLSTYGIGEEHSKKEWFHLSRQFIQKKLLIQDMEFGGLGLTDKAWKIMRGEEKVLGRLEERRSQKGIQKNQDYDRALFDLLKLERKRLADASNVPPYVVFPDRTLMEMAAFFPQSKTRLMTIHGVGAVKLDTYGPFFMGIIREYCKAHGIKESGNNITEPSMHRPVSTGGKRHHIIGGLFNAGTSITQIMERFNIKQDTVVNHLYTFMQEGGRLIESDAILSVSKLSPELKTEVLNRFKDLGAYRLKPVFDAFGGAIPYKELTILRLHHVIHHGVSGADAAPSTRLPHVRDIACLANSRKYSGRCIAGKAFERGRVGEWIRPVARNDTGELSVKEICYKDGNVPRLLDIMTVSLGRRHPHAYQTENYLVYGSTWERNGFFPASRLYELIDPVDTLWVNGYASASGVNDRIPEEIAREQIRSSLLFIQPETAEIIVEEGPQLLKRIRTQFSFKGEEYCLPITDPGIETRYFNYDVGRYPIIETPVYLTISIGEPYEGFCYKLVAGIVGIV